MEYIFIAGFVIWYTGALVVSENLGKKSKLGVEGSFFVSMIFSPVLGFVLTRFLKAS